MDPKYGYDPEEYFFTDPQGMEMLPDEVVRDLNALLAVVRAAEKLWPHIFNNDNMNKGHAEIRRDKLYEALAALPEHLAQSVSEK